MCDPSGIRTRVTAVRGRRTRPLYDGAVCDVSIMPQERSARQSRHLELDKHPHRCGDNIDMCRQFPDPLPIRISDDSRRIKNNCFAALNRVIERLDLPVPQPA